MASAYGPGRERAFFEGEGGRVAEYVWRTTGVYRSVLLAQMAVETAYGSSRLWVEGNNPAGITDPGTGGFREFLTLEDGMDWYRRVMLLSAYAPVRDSALAGDDPEITAMILGESPWDAAHYAQGCQVTYAGCQLVRVMQDWHLVQYDLAPPAWAGVGWAEVAGVLLAVAGAGLLVRPLVLRLLARPAGTGERRRPARPPARPTAPAPAGSSSPRRRPARSAAS